MQEEGWNLSKTTAHTTLTLIRDNISRIWAPGSPRDLYPRSNSRYTTSRNWDTPSHLESVIMVLRVGLRCFRGRFFKILCSRDIVVWRSGDIVLRCGAYVSRGWNLILLCCTCAGLFSAEVSSLDGFLFYRQIFRKSRTSPRTARCWLII